MVTVQQEQKLKGTIRILNGKYKDALLFMQDRNPLQIGRDLDQCNFILEAPWVSRLHCVIQYDFKAGCYHIQDVSENGTWLDGSRMKKREWEDVASSAILWIGEDGTQMQLL